MLEIASVLLLLMNAVRKRESWRFFLSKENCLLLHFLHFLHSIDDYKHLLFDGVWKIYDSLRHVWFSVNCWCNVVMWIYEKMTEGIASAKLSNQLHGGDVAIFPTTYIISFNEETTLPQKFPVLCAAECWRWWLLFLFLCPIYLFILSSTSSVLIWEGFKFLE